MTTENQIEQDLIDKLKDLKYVYREDIRDLESLENNFREKFEALNRVNLTEGEFSRLMEQIINPDVFVAAQHLREQNSFTREDGTPLHYTLVDIKSWCKNTFEVVNQLRVNTQHSHHRYDVILLINGVPVVQIELKTLTVSPRRAMEQIVNYKKDDGNGYIRTLLCFMQLFIVSNRTQTWYFANNNNKHFSFDADEQFLPIYQFADKENKKITHLTSSFAESFLSKCILGEMISRYMVLVATEQKLLMMRPYQVYAVEAIVDCINQRCGNGYIWHTTGSGKTLTSFKASTLLKDNPLVDKCLFVVDRVDLDRQTREEFNKFQEGCVEENTNTESLIQRLVSTDYADKVIVTTIQKLGIALSGKSKGRYKKRLSPLHDKRMAFIFDECHRSQFGKYHEAIKEFFTDAQLFGFTGTPIFPENASQFNKKVKGQEATVQITKDVFENEFPKYTITNAINDNNVLRFNVDYYTADGKENLKAGETLSKEGIVKKILEKHNIATAGRKFNALLATASINDAIKYYELFQEYQSLKQKEDDNYRPLNITCVFTPPPENNKDIKQLQEDLEQELDDYEKSTKEEVNEKKEALKKIIDDYDKKYGTNHSVSKFDLYYQDVQYRIKAQRFPNKDYSRDQKIDITIVVDMLLTGFDSKYLNTLYVDKNLKYHNLIQAFSRTNRILNDSKPYGNILSFRVREKTVNEAIALFSGEKDKNIARKIWLVKPASAVIDELEVTVKSLNQFMKSHNLPSEPDQVLNLKGDKALSEFVNRFRDVQSIKTQLDQYTDLTPDSVKNIEKLISQDRLQAFKGVYLDSAKYLKHLQDKVSGDVSEVVQQAELDLVIFSNAIIDYDYIMGLIADYASGVETKQKMTREQIVGLIESDSKFLNEREDIVAYIDELEIGKSLNVEDIHQGYEDFKMKQSSIQLEKVAGDHGLEVKALQGFVDGVMQRMILDGDELSDLLASLELGWKARTKKELELIADLKPLFEKLAQGHEISGLAAYE